jgi:hypothetical protein
MSVSPRNTTAETVKQWICPVDKKKKAPLLTKLINEQNWQQVLVFTRTKRGANQLTRHLEAEGIQSAAIHGNKSQGARTRALADFKAGTVRILVATDIAARERLYFIWLSRHYVSETYYDFYYLDYCLVYEYLSAVHRGALLSVFSVFLL